MRSPSRVIRLNVRQEAVVKAALLLYMKHLGGGTDSEVAQSVLGKLGQDIYLARRLMLEEQARQLLRGEKGTHGDEEVIA